MTTSIPQPTEPLIDGSGRITRNWYNYLRGQIGESAIAALQAQIDALWAAIEQGGSGSDVSLTGSFSVQVLGTAEDGFFIQLRNDTQTPDPASYYGTNAEGSRGWHLLSLDALSDVDLTTTPPADQDVLTYDLATGTWIPGPGGGSSPITTEGDLIVGDAAGDPDRLPVGAEGDVLTVVAGVPAWTPPAGGSTGAICFNVGNNVNVVTTGVKGRLYIPFDCEIESVHIVANAVGDLVLDIWADDFAAYPPVSGDSICGAAKPTLTIDDTYSDTTLTGWTTTLSEGDVLLFNVDSCSGISYFSGTLKVTKT